MTVLEAIHEFDSLKPNSFSQEQKIRWLDRLDSFILTSVFRCYPSRKNTHFTPGDPERILLMEGPGEEAYLHWLESKVHYFNEETERYNSAVRMFRSLFEDYQRQLNQEEIPENPGIFRF